MSPIADHTNREKETDDAAGRRSLSDQPVARESVRIREVDRAIMTPSGGASRSDNLPGVNRRASVTPKLSDEGGGTMLWLRTTDQLTWGILLAGALALLGYHLFWCYGPRPMWVPIRDNERWHADYHIDINETGWPPLTLLPGISETLARRIVAYRVAHGAWSDPQELQRVHGIGPKLVDKIGPYLTGWANTDDNRLATSAPSTDEVPNQNAPRDASLSHPSGALTKR